MKYIIATGLASMLALSTIFTITFFIAYYTPDKTLTITVNEFGEADLEFIVFAICLPLNYVTVVYCLYTFKRLETTHRHKNYLGKVIYLNKKDKGLQTHFKNY